MTAVWWVLAAAGVVTGWGTVEAVGPVVDRLYRKVPEGAVLSQAMIRLLLKRLAWLILFAVAALAVALVGIVGLLQSG